MSSATPNTIVEIDTKTSDLTPERPIIAKTIVAMPPNASMKPPYAAVSPDTADEEGYVTDIRFSIVA
jgi:hypothetical protein